MITIQQTVDIPASRRLTLEVPREVPEGRCSVVLVRLRDLMHIMPFAGIDGVEYQRELRDVCPD
ncbi:hypothetical protein ACYULU_07280 [Breznakiellaceae bacterium SP9]